MVERDPALEARLTEALGENLRGELRAFEEVASTMDAAHALAADSAVEGTLVWAGRQTGGRGRLGRVWESPDGGVYLSLIVRPARSAAEIPQLSLVAGLAAAEAIRECAMLSPRVRWPNDLLLGGKKIAGILTEARNGLPAAPNPGQTRAAQAGAVVIGIGINVTTSPSELPDAATSLAAAGGKNLDPLHLTARVYRRLFRWYDVWAGEGFAPVREALRPQMALFGEVVHISAGSEKLQGTARDLDEQGRLLVRLDSGLIRPFEMGEVTLLRGSPSPA